MTGFNALSLLKYTVYTVYVRTSAEKLGVKAIRSDQIFLTKAHAVISAGRM